METQKSDQLESSVVTVGEIFVEKKRAREKPDVNSWPTSHLILLNHVYTN